MQPTGRGVRPDGTTHAEQSAYQLNGWGAAFESACRLLGYKVSIGAERAFFRSIPAVLRDRHHPNANRLRCRYDAIINANVDILEGAKVLDVASHNGRWSAAAILGGKAAHVTGVEPRAELVEAATRTAAELSIADEGW